MSDKKIIVEYELVGGKKPATLAENFNKYIKKGWQPYGNPNFGTYNPLIQL